MKELFDQLQAQKKEVAVVGLGYVGLPLACLLAQKFKVVGFDINSKRVSELKDGVDLTKEVECREKLLNPNLLYTDDPQRIKQCAVIIVAVPTPVDGFNKPDLTPLLKASKTVGSNLSAGSIVVYESTVYPGVTEDICGKELEKWSQLTLNKDFFLGYSPERVNPGDKEHTIDKIVKVVSGSAPEVRDLLVQLYGSVITAGIHAAPSIATAEAAKVIENTQRDINIALINELSQIFEKAGLDTLDVLAAAGTKWNFLNFKPGLVGGHCIGVDPYYLTHLAEGLGVNPQIILAGRRINDNMSKFIAQKTIKLILSSAKYDHSKLRIGVLGVTFKENVPDLRNTKVIDLVNELEGFGAEVALFDPVADQQEFFHEYGRRMQNWESFASCHAIVVAVAHHEIRNEFPLPVISEKLRATKVLIDVKGMFDRTYASKQGITLWRP